MSSSISCTATASQPGHDRFPSSLPIVAPLIKPYRCNLIGLSHEYNHFYYAIKDTIHVFQPGYPDQFLPTTPALILYPPVSGPNLGFYMDPVNPHSINQLHIDYLGQEEIILAVCDDGDVIGYRTSAIQSALELKATKPDDDWNPQPRTMLHRNVGKSAWGLAVHKEARLIAISANNHLITIVAPALMETSQRESRIMHQNESHIRSSGNFPSNRTEEDVFTVSAHSNIPSVAFDNTGNDPLGRWLFGSDIQGITHLYDLHHRQSSSQKIHLGRCIGTVNSRQDPGPPGPNGCACGRFGAGFVRHAHWGAMFIDPRSFKHYDAYTDAFGVIPSQVEPCFWDTTSARKQRRTSTTSIPTNENFHAGSDIAGFGYSETQQGTESDVDMEAEEDVLVPSEDTQSQESDAVQHNDGAQQAVSPQSSVSSESSSDDEVYTHPVVWINWYPSLDASGRKKRKSYCEITGLGNLFLFNQTTSSPPCVIISKEEIYLLQSSYCSHNETDFSPIITMQNPLYHETEDYDDKEPWTQRQNLFAQIPELGVFIVGSNTGRCAVYSLTQVKTRTASAESEKIIYGFRQECILPFGEQEAHNQMVPKQDFLAGLAVSPVQGSLNREQPMNDSLLEERRWRIMMLFSDHTVMNYEIARKREPGSLDLGGLMV